MENEGNLEGYKFGVGDIIADAKKDNFCVKSVEDDSYKLFRVMKENNGLWQPFPFCAEFWMSRGQVEENYTLFEKY